MTRQGAFKKCIRAASRKLPFRSERKMREYLSYACGSLEEAYVIGAEEAQGAIVQRLVNLATSDGGSEHGA